MSECLWKRFERFKKRSSYLTPPIFKSFKSSLALSLPRALPLSLSLSVSASPSPSSLLAFLGKGKERDGAREGEGESLQKKERTERKGERKGEGEIRPAEGLIFFSSFESVISCKSFIDRNAVFCLCFLS